jgi:hypothetical protein
MSALYAVKGDLDRCVMMVVVVMVVVAAAMAVPSILTLWTDSRCSYIRPTATSKQGRRKPTPSLSLFDKSSNRPDSCRLIPDCGHTLLTIRVRPALKRVCRRVSLELHMLVEHSRQ